MNKTVEMIYSYSVEWIESEKEEWSLRCWWNSMFYGGTFGFTFFFIFNILL